MRAGDTDEVLVFALAAAMQASPVLIAVRLSVLPPTCGGPVAVWTRRACGRFEVMPDGH